MVRLKSRKTYKRKNKRKNKRKTYKLRGGSGGSVGSGGSATITRQKIEEQRVRGRGSRPYETVS